MPKAVAAKAGVAKAKVAASVAPAGGERQIAAAVPAAASVAEAKPTKASTAKAGGASARKAPPVVTTIEVRYDVGLGNQLFIRGEGAGLNWDAGLPMECRGGDLWVWTTDKPVENIVFKVLVNDAGWSLGENFSTRPGDRGVFFPSF